MSIMGEKLSATTRIWRGDDIVDGRLPTQLDSVRVRVNEKDAFVYFVSPTQSMCRRRRMSPWEL
jgi:uncharacterized protein (TIGR03437 family)